MDLKDLIANAPKPDASQLFKCNAEGFLLDDQFYNFELPLSGRKGEDDTHKPLGKAVLNIRARFTPYAALRQQFWRQYMRQFDADKSGAMSEVELFAMLDSLGSTLSHETLDSFFKRYNKSKEGSLTFDEVVACLEDEVAKSLHQKKRIDRSTAPSGTSTPAVGLADNSGGFGTTGLQSALPEANRKLEATTVPTSMDKAVLTSEKDEVVEASPDKLTTSATNEPTAEREQPEVERIVNIKACPLCHKPRLNKRSEADIITHLAICASQDWTHLNSMVVGNYVTSVQAHRKWLGKLVSRGTVRSICMMHR